MNDYEGNETHNYALLALISATGFLLQLLWALVVGALDLGRSDRVSTWLMLALALVLVAIAISSTFRRYIEGWARQPSLPAQVFVINGLSILLVGAFLLILLESSPHILANFYYLGDALFLGGLFVLIILSLLANMVAYIMDRSRA